MPPKSKSGKVFNDDKTAKAAYLAKKAEKNKSKKKSKKGK